MREETPQRACAKVGIKALLRECLQCIIRPRERDVHLTLKAFAERLQHDRRNALDILLCESLKDDGIVDAVQELGAEVLLEQRLHRRRCLRIVLAEDLMRAEIARHDDDGVLEVHYTSLAVRQASVVEDLKQHVEHVAMRLFDLIEQNDAVRTTAHCLSELTALVIADVSRRRADETRDTVLLHVLAHIDADHAPLIVKERLRKGLGELCLADTRRAKEDKRADRTVRILDSGTCTQNRLADSGHRLILSDNALMEHILQTEQLLALTRHHLRDGDTRPAADDAGNILLADLLLEHLFTVRLCSECRFLVGKLLLKLRHLAVFQFRCTGEVLGALGCLHLTAQFVHLLFDGTYAQNCLLFTFPLLLELLLLCVKAFLLGDKCREFFLRVLVRLLFQRLLLDVELENLAPNLIEWCGHGLNLRAQLCRCLIDEVNRLVGQESIGNITVRECRRGDEGRVADAHTVMHLVAILQSAQDGDGVLHRRLADHNGLEATLKCRVLIDVLAVLVQCRSTDAAQFPAREERL